MIENFRGPQGIKIVGRLWSENDGESRPAWVIWFCGGGPKWRGWSGGLDWVEADGEPKCVGLADNAAHGEVGVESGEVVAAEIGVVDIAGEHVPHRNQDRVLHGDKGFLLAHATGETAVSSAEVSGVFGAGRSHRGGAQRTDQPPVAVAGFRERRLPADS